MGVETIRFYEREGLIAEVSGVTAIESTYPLEAELDLIDAILPHIRWRSERVRRARVGIFGGAEPRVVLGPVQECGPVLANRASVARLLERTARRRTAPRGTVEVQVFVEANGVPSHARIDAATQHLDVDAVAISVAREMRFLPARAEGVPVPVWVSLPVTFLVR